MHGDCGVKGDDVWAVVAINVAQTSKNRGHQAAQSKDLRCDGVLRSFSAQKNSEEPSMKNPNAVAIDILPAGDTRKSVHGSRSSISSIPKLSLRQYSPRVSKPTIATSNAQICPHGGWKGIADLTRVEGRRNSQSASPATTKQKAVFGFIVA